MKPAVYILSFTLLFLMVQPMLINCQTQVKATVAMSGCIKNKGCHKAKKTENKACDKTKDCDKTNACNPFASCSQCQYTVVSKFFYAGSIVQILKNKLPSQNNNIESGFINDFWQPPEWVPI